MEGARRDNTEDWLVPRHAVPTVGELEARIDEALVIARASEEGVREVGEMALGAARQARRAAEAAEQSARAAVEAAVQGARPAGPVADETSSSPPQVQFTVRFRSFNERADRVAARLRALQDHPRHSSAPSAGAMRWRGDG